MPESTCHWNSSSVCVVDASGKIVREAKVASEPEALISWFRLARIEVGADRPGGGAVVAMALCGRCGSGLAGRACWRRGMCEMRFKAMPVKTDRNDARGIAQLMRLGWFRPVHCKSMAAQEVRALLTARKLVQTKLHDVEMSLRGILRGFGLKVGRDDAAQALRRGSANWSPAMPTPGDDCRGAAGGARGAAARVQGLEKRVRRLAAPTRASGC